MRNRFLPLAAGIAVLMFNADKGGASGGGGKKTDLEQLQEAQEENKQLRADLATAKTSITTLEGEKAELNTKLTAEQGKVTQLETDKTELTTRADKAEADVKKLQGESKTTDQKAAEIAAAHGSLPAKKDGENAANNGGGTDGKALYDQYSKLNGREAADFWDKHSKALIAYGEQCEREMRARD